MEIRTTAAVALEGFPSRAAVGWTRRTFNDSIHVPSFTAAWEVVETKNHHQAEGERREIPRVICDSILRSIACSCRSLVHDRRRSQPLLSLASWTRFDRLQWSSSNIPYSSNRPPCLLCGSRKDLEQPAVWSHIGIIFVHVQAPAQHTTFYQKLSRQLPPHTTNRFHPVLRIAYFYLTLLHVLPCIHFVIMPSKSVLWLLNEWVNACHKIFWYFEQERWFFSVDFLLPN